MDLPEVQGTEITMSDIDTDHRSFPTCPHCGSQETDDYYDLKEGDLTYCGSCSKNFIITEVDVSMTFSTKKAEGRDGNEDRC